MSTDIEFEGRVGETIVKQPGSLSGASVNIRNLNGCKVYLLDFTSDVEVTDVADCEIFIGPVDGLAKFTNVANSRIAVAAQQFQAKDVSSVSFELFSANRPSFNNCEAITITPWQASYPGIEEHYIGAGLDLNNNQWTQAQDISEIESEVPPFQLQEFSDNWNIPFEHGNAQNGGFGEQHGGFGEPHGAQNGFLDPADFTEPAAEHPKLTQVKDRLKERQESQESREKAVKSELVQKASNYLEEFYANRKKRMENRAKTNRESEQAVPVGGVEGSSEWDKATKLIDFSFARPNGTDLSRFKNVMFTAKSKNVPINGKPAAV